MKGRMEKRGTGSTTWVYSKPKVPDCSFCGKTCTQGVAKGEVAICCQCIDEACEITGCR